MEQKKHWPQVETLYVLGILLVLIGHSHSSDRSAYEGTVLFSAVFFIYTFHMALFFFLAGFLFRNSDALERKGYGTWIGEKALRLLTPYGFWTLLSLVPKYYLEHGGLGGLTPRFVLRTLIMPRSNIWGHFWFIPVLFFAYAIFGAVRSLARRVPDKWLLAVLTAVSCGIYFLPIRTELFGLADLKSVLIFFALGMVFRAYFPVRRLSTALHDETSGQLPDAEPSADRARPARRLGHLKRACWAAVPVGTAAAFLLWRSAGELAPAALAIALLMLFLCWLLGELIPPSRVTRWLAQRNFGIYIFSWFFQAAMMMVCDRLHLSWVGTFFCMFFIGLAGPVVLLAVCEKLPLMKNRFFRLILGLR